MNLRKRVLLFCQDRILAARRVLSLCQLSEIFNPLVAENRAVRTIRAYHLPELSLH